MDARARKTSAREAYGEVVWFGRRGAGVKSARSKLLTGDGGKRAVLRGEHEVSRKAIAQGRPECSRCPVCSCARFVCANRTRDRGCSKHPVFPAPSVSRRAIEDANLGRKCAARSRNYVVGSYVVGWVERSDTHRCTRAAWRWVSLRSTHPTGLSSSSRGITALSASLRAQRSNPCSRIKKNGLLRCARNDVDGPQRNG